jgi:hypothetical protein
MLHRLEVGEAAALFSLHLYRRHPEREGEELVQNTKRIVAEHILQAFIAATVLLTLAFVLLGPHGVGAVS